MAVITISRQTGSGGGEIATELSNRLGFRLIDRPGLDELLRSYGPDDIDLPQVQNTPPGTPFADRKLYIELLNTSIVDMAERENFILLGRGGQCIFRDVDDALHVRLIASEENRIHRLVEVEGMSREGARKTLTDGEARQRSYIRSLFSEDVDDPKLYDLVLRTDRLDDRDACIQIVLQTYGQCSLAVHPPEREEDSRRPSSRVDHAEANGPAKFANRTEVEFARILDFYQIKWRYEPATFPLDWDEGGRVTEAFSPDFYLEDSDTYIELTTLRQSLVTKKNRKLRRLKELYPEVNVRIFYRKDYEQLLAKYGLLKGAKKVSPK